ncbi:hypothetical protein U1Q18_011353 [Sarracenia purpurea var. burkii]
MNDKKHWVTPVGMDMKKMVGIDDSGGWIAMLMMVTSTTSSSLIKIVGLKEGMSHAEGLNRDKGLNPLPIALAGPEQGPTRNVNSYDVEAPEEGIVEGDDAEQVEEVVVTDPFVLRADEGDRVVMVQRSQRKDKVEGLPQYEEGSQAGIGKALAENEIQITDEMQRARLDKGKGIANLDIPQVSEPLLSHAFQHREGGRFGLGGRGGRFGSRGGRHGIDLSVWKEKRKGDEGTSVTKQDTHQVFDKRPKPRN